MIFCCIFYNAPVQHFGTFGTVKDALQIHLTHLQERERRQTTCKKGLLVMDLNQQTSVFETVS